MTAGGDFLTGAVTRGYVVRLVAGILASVFIPLGVAFTAIGLADGPDAFVAIGIPFAAAGLALLLAWALLRSRGRGAAERDAAARSARAPATVERVELHPYVRVGSLVTLTLTVRFSPGGGERSFSRRLHVSPLARLETGQRIEVAYDPGEPENFAPVG